MNKIKKSIIPILAACGLFILILDARTATSGAQEGVQLCIRTLIPSLFPFFLVSGYFCKVYSEIKLPFLRPIMHLCRMPSGTEPLLVIGLLGGYPVGAKAIADAYAEGRIHKDTAKRMLGFCSNAGPSFVFGIIGGLFGNWFISWILMLVLILSSIITGWLLPSQNKKSPNQRDKKEMYASRIFSGSLHAIASVCGWVVLFRVLLTILKRWFLWLLPGTAQIVITGVLELSNGCIELSSINNDGLRFWISAGILSFGGICVYLQTISVTGTLGTGYYFPGKIVQCLISLILSGIAQAGLFSENNRISLKCIIIPLAILSICIIVIKIYNFKKTVAIP